MKFLGKVSIEPEERAVLLVLSLCLLAPFLWPALAGGEIIGNIRGDSSEYWYFVYQFGADCWKQGSPPLWNPYVEFGYSFVGEGQGGAFYPFTVLFMLFEYGRALSLYLGLHFLMGGLFYYAYLRRLDLGSVPSGLASFVLCYSSLYLARFHAGHFSIVPGISWGIGLLFCWETYFRTRRPEWLLVLSLIYGLFILSGYPYLVLIFSIFLILYAGLSILCGDEPGDGLPSRLRMGGKDLALLALVLSLGIGISMISLLPSYVNAGLSYRQKISYDFASTFSFPPENLLTLISPWFFGESLKGYAGDPTVVPYFGRNSLWENWFYMGIAPLLAVLVGLVKAPPKTRTPLLLCLGFFFSLMLGKHTPLHRFFFDHAPLVNYFRGPSRYMVVVFFCLTTFAAYGFEAWLGGREKVREYDRSRILIGVCFLCSVIGIATFLNLSFHNSAGEIEGSWAQFLKWIDAQGESGAILSNVNSEIYLRATWRNAQSGLWRALLLALLSTGLYLGGRRLTSKTALPVLLFLLIAVDLGPVFSTYLLSYPADALNRAVATLPHQLSEQDGLPKRVAQLVRFQNLGMVKKYSNVGGYLGNAYARYNQYVNRATGIAKEDALSQIVDLREISPQFATAGVEYWLFAGNEIPDNAPGVVARNSDYALLTPNDSSPRVYLGADPRSVDNPEQALEIVLSDGQRIIDAPVLEGLKEVPPSHPLESVESITVTGFTVNSVDLKVQAARPRVVVLTEMTDPGWKARVNGEETTVYVANYLFRAVVVPPGESVVKFWFEPESYRWGKGITFASLLLWAIVCLGLRVLRPVAPPNPPAGGSLL